MNRPHAERKPFLVPINDETKHEGETQLTPKPVEELPPPPKIDKYKLARFLTDKAIREKRIFTICGPYPVIRTALRKRGWVERKYITKGDPQDHKDNGNETENDNIAKTESKSGLREDENHSNNTSDIHELMSRLVRNEETSFYWTIKKDAVDYYNLHVDQMLNHYARTGSFTTKIGLCLNMRNLPWYVSANQNAFFPRCYGICMDDEKCDFIDDFRKTAAACIVKWVVNLHVSSDKNKRSCAENTDTENSTEESDAKKTKELPGQIVEMACKVCETYLHQIEHEDIDTDLNSAPVLSEKEWNQLLEQYYCLIHEDAIIRNADNYFAQCQNILHKILLADPQQKIDGLHNIWIIKPGAKSRGREIVCKNRLEDILKLVEPTDQIPIKDHKWVVQKYIETPLLIYDTKFDIRQWFLVTDWNPLTLWFYKESYLRFSTQRFSLDNLHSSIHLCNNSIQKNYKNAPDRSSQLPHHNMWTSTKFQEYLQKKGFGHVWCNVIYPSMKKILIYTMRMAQDQVESRKSSFELYGADFILGNDFKPWLIEINSSPTMYPSTPITSDLCAQVQEDTIRVVIDRKIDRNSNIGKFELLWKQPILDLPPFNPADLFVEGINVKRLRNQPVPLSNFNFLEPLVSVVHPEINEENKRDASGSVNDKQNIKVKQGTSIPCTLPKTLKKLQEKTLKVKSAQKKPNKFIDFPRIVYDHEATSMADKKKMKAIKEPNHQTGTQAGTTFAKSNALDWALLQPSKDAGLQDKNKKTPCLICGDSFQPTKACKHCSSFCATVLQGGSYLPMGSCSPPEKMGKNRLAVPCYGLPKYF